MPALQPAPRADATPRPLAVLEPASTHLLTAEGAQLGLYDTSRLAPDFLAWAQAARAAWEGAPEGSDEARMLRDLKEVCYRASASPELLDEALRRQLWGARGALSDPHLVAQGLRHFHDALRSAYELMDPTLALIEAVRCYGDYLTYYHPEGQRAPGPPFAVYTPFRDLLPPAAPHEVLDHAAALPAPSDLRAQLLAELRGEDAPADLAPSRPSLLLVRQQEREARPHHPDAHPASEPESESEPSTFSHLKDAVRRHAPAVVVSTLALTVLDLLRGGR